MRTLTILLLGLIVASHAAVLPSKIAADGNAALWEAWKEKFGKKYETAAEELNRFNIWGDNLKIVAKHNVEADFGLQTYTVEMNEFSDLTKEEFLASHTGYRSALPVEKTSDKAFSDIDASSLPKEVNWTREGWVTPVKNQGGCGSCWAFSATGSLEGQHFNATGNLVSLSEEQLVECVQAGGSHDPCNGGDSILAFRYLEGTGSVSEADYKYPNYTKDAGIVGICKADGLPIAATVAGVVQLGYASTQRSEIILQAATATVGPISVYIDADHLGPYKEGIFNPRRCSSKPQDLNHAVLVVGYGTDDDTGLDYWLVKNSWGAGWGHLGGYVKMIRNAKNHCGIATSPFYPVSGDY